MNKKKIVSNILEIRNNTFEIIIVTIFIALGINLLTSGLLPSNDVKNFKVICIISGMILILLSLFIRTRTMLHLLNKGINIKGFFVYNKDTKEILPIDQYEITKDMNKYLKSTFHEKKAIKYIWDNNPINANNENTTADNQLCLLSELIEYCILKKLSYLLLSYFGEYMHLNEKELIEYKRNDLPELLLNNRFLNLFSEPMENRDAFIGKIDKERSIATIKKDNGKECILQKTLPDGSMFEWFYIILPKNSTITKKDKNTVLINLREFSIEISNSYQGNGYIDGNFYDYYLGINDYFDNYDTFNFDIEIKVNFKTRSLIRLRKQNYYLWIDDFIRTLTEYSDRNEFLERIKWNETKSFITCYKNLTKGKSNDD